MWNNRYETLVFRRNQEKKREEYKKLGMTQEQIEAIEMFDKRVFLGDRSFYTYNGCLDDSDWIGEENAQDDVNVRNFAFFEDKLAEGISDERLLNLIFFADDLERSIIFHLKKGTKKAEIARILGVSRKTVYDKIEKMRQKAVKRIKN